MGTVKYKEISESLSRLTKPATEPGRVSVGLEKNIGEFYFLNVDDLYPFKNQARSSFNEDEINNLAESIKKHGVRHPLTVISSDIGKGKFEVVSGERRLRAAKIAGLRKVPCILLKEVELAEEVAIIENIHRQDLHPIELGIAFSYLLKKGICDTQEEISKKLSVPKSIVSEHLSFANLKPEIREFVIKNKINSREKLRKFVKYEKDEDMLYNLMLELKGGKKANFSVIRISYDKMKFKLQTTGIKKLDIKQKEELALCLQNIIQELNH